MARSTEVHKRGSNNEVFTETSLALAKISLDDPLMYSVADMNLHNRRRWRACEKIANDSLIEDLFAYQFDRHGDSRYATHLVASTLSHAVIGRVLTSFEHSGRIWDPHVSNLYIRSSSLPGVLDWVGVERTVIRTLPNDRFAKKNYPPDVQITLPGEREMAYWLAGRAETSLRRVLEVLAVVSHCNLDRLWATIGRDIAFTAPVTARQGKVCREVTERRAQFVLDALYRMGHPVRGGMPLPRSLQPIM